MLKHIFVIISLLYCCQVCYCGYHGKRLLSYLFNDSKFYGHNPLERPILDENQSLEVQFKVTLLQILDLDEKNQVMNTNIWLDITWNDYNFIWNPEDYGNITTLILPSDKIWKPDILMYNSADEKFDGTFPANVVVTNKGLMHMVPPGMFKSTCKINITWFPFDQQSCVMKFGTWTYTGDKVDFKLKCDGNSNCTGKYGSADITSFLPNGEWEIVDVPAEKHTETYPCCPESPYIDIKFHVKMRRKALYYIFNLMTPCIIISTMSLLVFTLPPGAGEKISLGVTIMLSLTMFLFMVADKLPQTSGSVPLIGLYFSCIMIMCSFSVVFTVLVLNCHHKSGEDEEMPYWLKVLVNRWLANFLFMSPRNPQMTSSPKKKLEIQQRKSILPNLNHSFLTYENLAPKPYGNTNTQKSNTQNVTCTKRVSNICSQNNYGKVNTRSKNIYKNSYIKPVICNHSATKCSIFTELQDVIHELKQITDKIQEEHCDFKKSNEWKFAARVIDRFCLLSFALFTLISSVVILTSAPDMTI